MEKHYILINGTVNVSDSKMPLGEDYVSIKPTFFNKTWFESDTKEWLSSLQPCEIDESELEKIKNKVYTFDNCKADNPIDITDIVRVEETRTETKSGGWADYKIYFKQPKQVESECEAVECKDDNIDAFINKYIYDLPKNWRSDLDMYLAMKNAMIQALSYPDKYTIKRNI